MRRVWTVMGLCLVTLLTISAATATNAPASLNGAAAWGENSFGGLGDGTTESRDVPGAVHELTGVSATSSGLYHSLALLEGGTVRSWGRNDVGELGNGSTSNSSLPLPVKELSGVTAISDRERTGYALLSNGTVMAWGYNGHGQLGDGTSSGPETCIDFLGKPDPCSRIPVAVHELIGVTAVANGGNHGLALLSNGTVMAWGENGVGQLGNGTTTSSAVPVAVSGLSEVRAISAGQNDSVALLENGTVVAWGDNSRGELGTGTTSGPELCGSEGCSRTPVAVTGLSGVTAISAGGYASNFALLENGTVKAWGENLFGNLGDGTILVRDVPVAVSGLSGVTAIAAGDQHTLALVSGGAVMAWGDNNNGQLGDGTNKGPAECGLPEHFCSKTPIAVVGLTGASGISAGTTDSFAYGSKLHLGNLPEPEPEEMFGGQNAGEPNQRRACANDPVSCATGNLTETQSDLNMSALGVPLALTRTYNAQGAVTQSSPGPFGYGWSSSFNDHLAINPGAGTVTVVQANGSAVIFRSIGGPGELIAPNWAQAKLLLNGEGTYTYTLPSQEAFYFDASGRLQAEVDRSGNTTTMNRNAEGRLEAITDAAGRKLTLAYNPSGEVESIKDPLGHTVTYAYEAGNLASVTLPGAATARWQFKYDTMHRLTILTDGRGGKTTNEYDGANRVTSQTDPAERTTSFEYGPLQTTITNKATGSVTKEIFTEGDEPEAITRGYGTSSATTESSTYDPAGNLTRLQDGNGHTTKYEYDSAGNRTSLTDASEHKTHWTYNSTRDVLTTTTPDGETTTYVRNSAGEPETISRPAPAGTTQVTAYKYDSHGNVESMEDPLKRAWKYGYDAQGDRVSETDPEGDKRTWEYDGDSRETATVSPRGNVTGGEPAKYTTKTERDAQGRPLTVTDPLGHKASYTYDANSNLETQTDPNEHKTKYTYNADNERTKIAQPNGTVTETGYDGAGQVISQTDGNKHTTRSVRNVLEQVIEVLDPRERKAVREYDKAGNLTKLTDAAKRTTSNIYDGSNRLSEVSYSDGKTAAVKYEYNGDGIRKHIADGSGATSYTYDQLDRLAESKDGHGNTTKYEYDLANQLTKITYPNGKAVARAFDKAGRLEKVTDWLEHATKFAYAADSELVTTTFPTGTSNVDKYAYNEAGQMSEVKVTKGAETLASLIYTRDSLGQVKKVTSKGLPGAESTEYTYDANSRLTNAGTTGYEYDPANNPTKIATGSYVYDKASELETGPSLKYAYDELGERIKTTPTSGSATTYGYDQAENLISLERPKEGKVAEIKDTYAYDGDNLRVSQTISGTKTFLAWEMAEAVPVVLNDGTNSFIYGPGGLPIEQISGAGTALYPHHDQQGSTRMLTGSTGKSEATTTYDAYGNTTGTTGTAITPLGYDAQYTSTDTGLIYLRARTYDPKTAQFLTSDPLGSQTHQPYDYAGDNPLSSADPSGMCGASSVGAVLESVNPFSEENCAYQAVNTVVGLIGADPSQLATVTGIAGALLTLTPAAPLGIALVAVSSAASAYAAGHEAADGNILAAALDGLGAVLGGAGAAERVLGGLESLIPTLSGLTAAERTRALAQTLERLGYAPLAASILTSQMVVVEGGPEPGTPCVT
jgi:RHS repeat-associated protein